MTWRSPSPSGEGAEAVICASTGNTSASMAAYAARARVKPRCSCRRARSRPGKLAQAIVHGAQRDQVAATSTTACASPASWPTTTRSRWSTRSNPIRIEGQKTAAFEIVDVLGDAPDVHVLPVGNAGNITAYWKGYIEYAKAGIGRPARRGCSGFQAAGRRTARLRRAGRRPGDGRDGDPDRQPGVVGPRGRRGDESGGRIEAVTDEQILAAQRLLAASEGVFVEPASAASVAGLLAGRGGRTSVRRSAAWSSPSPATASRTSTPALSHLQPTCVDTVVDADVDAAAADRLAGARAERPTAPSRPGPRARHQRQPRARLRLLRSRAGPARRGRGARRSPTPRAVTVDGEGATVPRDETAPGRTGRCARAFDALGAAVPGVRLHCRNAIPHGRGLGLVVRRDRRRRGRGASAGRRRRRAPRRRAPVRPGRRDRGPSRQRGAALSRRLHHRLRPRTVGSAPVRLERRIRTSRRRGLRAGRTRSTTKVARGLLPEHGPARRRGRQRRPRGAAGRRAHAGRPTCCSRPPEDRLHQDYREPAMPASLEPGRRELRAAGDAAVVSGAGPTVLVARRRRRRGAGVEPRHRRVGRCSAPARRPRGVRGRLTSRNWPSRRNTPEWPSVAGVWHTAPTTVLWCSCAKQATRIRRPAQALLPRILRSRLRRAPARRPGEIEQPLWTRSPANTGSTCKRGKDLT